MKKTRFFIYLLIMVFLLFELAGYKNAEIDKYFYIVGMGIDFGENDLIKVSVQIANTSSKDSSSDSSSSKDKKSDSSSSGESKSSGENKKNNSNIYSAEAPTINSAITMLNNFLNKKINLSHCSVLVFSEEIAKSGIQKYISTLGNNTELRHSCIFMISSKSAFEVLENVSTFGDSLSSRMYNYLTSSIDYTGYTVNSTFGSFYSNLQNYERDAIGIYTEVNDDEIQNNGIAVFKDDVMVGTLDILDTISHLIVTNDLESTLLTIPSCFVEKEYIDLETKLYKKTKVKINFENGIPKIKIDIYPQATILSSGSFYDYTSFENMEKVKNLSDSYIKENVSNYLNKISHELNSDIVGFGGLLATTVPTQKVFNSFDFQGIYPNSNFEVNVNTKIQSSNLYFKQ